MGNSTTLLRYLHLNWTPYRTQLRNSDLLCDRLFGSTKPYSDEGIKRVAFSQVKKTHLIWKYHFWSMQFQWIFMFSHKIHMMLRWLWNPYKNPFWLATCNPQRGLLRKVALVANQYWRIWINLILQLIRPWVVRLKIAFLHWVRLFQRMNFSNYLLRYFYLY